MENILIKNGFLGFRGLKLVWSERKRTEASASVSTEGEKPGRNGRAATFLSGFLFWIGRGF